MNYLNTNHTNSNKIINPNYTGNISNRNNFNKKKLEIESSFKVISSSPKRKLQKTMDDSQIYNLNQLKDRILKYKTKLGNNLLYKNDNTNQLNSKILFTKRDKENIMNLTPVNIRKNSSNIQKYIHYLLSYKDISKFPNFDNNLKDKNMIKLKEKRKNSINIFKKKITQKNKIKSRNANNEMNYYEFNTINNSALSYGRKNLFSFNSGSYELPLMTQIIKENKKEEK